MFITGSLVLPPPPGPFGLAKTLTPRDLPFELPPVRSVKFTYVPSTDLNVLPLLCDGADMFTVFARAIRPKTPVNNSALTTVTLSLRCDALVCGPGEQVSTTGTGQRVCLNCSQGFYNLDVNGSCKACPVGGECSGASILAMPGYWYHDFAFYECASGRCCVNGGCDVMRDGNVCSGGRAGVLCSGCANSDYVPWGSDCVHCTKVAWGPVLLLLGVCGMMVVNNCLTSHLLCSMSRSVAAAIIVVVMLFNNYSDIQSRFEQYIDYNQLMDVVIRSSDSNALYYVQEVLLCLFVRLHGISA
jgi:hypothetical protein